ncbi:hypothetical protein PTI98_007149 [Pleurotus ostreatus]|nr:hypothetical protein PTI98_007149 [Pleurotus ostreatus]
MPPRLRRTDGGATLIIGRQFVKKAPVFYLCQCWQCFDQTSIPPGQAVPVSGRYLPRSTYDKHQRLLNRTGLATYWDASAEIADASDIDDDEASDGLLNKGVYEVPPRSESPSTEDSNASEDSGNDSVTEVESKPSPSSNREQRRRRKKDKKTTLLHLRIEAFWPMSSGFQKPVNMSANIPLDPPAHGLGCCRDLFFWSSGVPLR